MTKGKNTIIMWSTFAIASLFMLSVFTGCKKDDPIVVVNPVILFASPTDGESKISGSSVTLAFTANTDNGIKRVVVKYKASNGVEVTKFDSVFNSQPTNFVFSRNYTVGILGTETYTVAVTDKKDNIQTKSVNIKSITGFADETFGKTYHILGSKNGAFDLLRSEERLNTDPDIDKDMVNGDLAGVYTGGWESKNTTQYVKAPGFNYTTGTSTSAENAYVAGTPNAKVTAPVAGDIYIAKLRGTITYVVIKIIANDPLNNECGCSNTGKLTFSLKKSL